MATKTKPHFSIIIPTLNEEEYLPELLKDLASRSFTNFEVIVVDAQSKDKTCKKAQKFASKFSKLSIITSKKRNVSYQRNLGAKNAIADWLMFMDADSRIPSCFLEEIKLKISLLNPDLLSTWMKPDTDNVLDKVAAIFMNLYVETQKLLKIPYMLEAVMYIKKPAFNKLKGFNEDLACAEGSDLLKRALKQNMTYCLLKNPKHVCSFRRIRKDGMLKILINTSQLEIARLMNKKIPMKKVKKLYPMEGRRQPA